MAWADWTGNVVTGAKRRPQIDLSYSGNAGKEESKEQGPEFEFLRSDLGMESQKEDKDRNHCRNRVRPTSILSESHQTFSLDYQ